MQQDFSFWEYETYARDWDVCIIGSGITGLSTGISILEREPKLQVLVVDRWFIPLGASTRNAGFSCFGSPSEILDDIEKMGEEAALSLVQQRWQGLQLLKERLKKGNAHYENYGGYELYHQEEYVNIASRLPYLNQLLETATQHQSVFHEVPMPKGISGFSYAIHNSLDGQLHPGYMMEELKRQYLELGGVIHTGFEIESIHQESDHVQLINSLAIPIKARNVVVTINAFAARLLPQLDVHGVRNHVLVTNEIANLEWKGCFHYDKGFYYFRNVGKRILLGGARNRDMDNENTEQFGFNELIVDTLKQFLYDHLADKNTCRIDFQWSGIIGFGKVKLPIVKAVSSNVFVGVPLSGIGIATASLIGEQLAGMLLQQEGHSERLL